MLLKIVGMTLVKIIFMNSKIAAIKGVFRCKAAAFMLSCGEHKMAELVISYPMVILIGYQTLQVY